MKLNYYCILLFPAVVSSTNLQRFQQVLFEHQVCLQKCLDDRIFQDVGDCQYQWPVFYEPLVTIDYSTNWELLDTINILESNSLLNKVLLTLTDLCQEIDCISNESQQLQMRFLYLDEELAWTISNELTTLNTNTIYNGSGDNDIDSNAIVWEKISEAIKSLYQIQFLLQRFTILGSNIFCQLGALLTKQSQEAGLNINLMVRI